MNFGSSFAIKPWNYWNELPSRVVYEDPDFVDGFMAITPVDQIAQLQLGSRPARRGGSAGIGDLRAIPWVFSWTQSRVILPAWYGLGCALKTAREERLVRESAQYMVRIKLGKFDGLYREYA